MLHCISQDPEGQRSACRHHCWLCARVSGAPQPKIHPGPLPAGNLDPVLEAHTHTHAHRILLSHPGAESIQLILESADPNILL